MTRLFVNIACVFALIASVGACSSNEWENVPGPVSKFLTEYFPLQAVSQCSYETDSYHVKLRNSTALTFDSDYRWTSVNGYGNTLPEMFLFDELPPALYAYLQELSLTGEVYSVTRDNKFYHVMLLDSSITYDIATGVVSPDSKVSTAITHLGVQ